MLSDQSWKRRPTGDSVRPHLINTHADFFPLSLVPLELQINLTQLPLQHLNIPQRQA